MTDLTQEEIQFLAAEVMGWEKVSSIKFKGYGLGVVYKRTGKPPIKNWQPHKNLNQAFMLLDNFDEYTVSKARPTATASA